MFIATFVGLGFVTPGYSLVRDTISALELNPFGMAQQANFFVFGVLICMFAVGLRREMQEGFGAVLIPFFQFLGGLGVIGDALFIHDGPHLACDLVAFNSSLCVLFLFAWRFRRDPRWRGCEIMLNADGTLWIERLTAGMECIGTMQPSQAESVICSVAAFHKQIVTRESPIFEGELPLNGERFEALIPPVVSAPVFTIRLKASKVFTLGEYVDAGIMTAQQKEVIEGAVINRQNILVVGGTGTGKTTLTNAIIDAIERLTPEHRLIIIEDTAEIQCAAKNANLLHATDTVDMLRLLKATMRLRPIASSSAKSEVQRP